MQLVKYPIIITIDLDLENDPEHILTLIQRLAKFHSCGFAHQVAQNLRENSLQNIGQTVGRD
jgi:hypothetical protein